MALALQVGPTSTVHNTLGDDTGHDLPTVVQQVEDHRHQDQTVGRSQVIISLSMLVDRRTDLLTVIQHVEDHCHIEARPDSWTFTSDHLCYLTEESTIPALRTQLSRAVAHK